MKAILVSEDGFVTVLMQSEFSETVVIPNKLPALEYFGNQTPTYVIPTFRRFDNIYRHKDISIYIEK